MRTSVQVAVLATTAALAIRVYARPAAPTIVPSRTVMPPWSAEARGRIAFERYGCRLCHGEDGKGGLANPNSQTGKVPSLDIDFAGEGYTIAELRKLILNGVARIDRDDPKGAIPPYRMPGWAGQMSEQEVDDLIGYLQTLHKTSAGKRTTKP